MTKRRSFEGMRSVMARRASRKGTPELLLLEAEGELAFEGLGGLLGDDLNGGGERVTGAESAGEEIDGVGGERSRSS